MSQSWPKRVLFWALLAIISSVGTAALSTMAYLGYRKLTFSYDYCGSYGTFDDELGWRLRENASSCLSLRNRLTGRVFFDSRIYTNRLGFRDSAPGREAQRGAIVAIGDSWTFGYGVNHEESYPFFLEGLTGLPVVNMGVPAYGAGSVLTLFRRHVDRLQPRIVIYFTLGIWDRSVCPDSPTETLVPCFSKTDAGEVKLILPKPGAVSEAVRQHRYPGGALTAGYDSLLSYMLFVKPRELADRGVRRVRAALGQSVDDPARRVSPDAVMGYELREYATLGRMYGFSFVLVDPGGAYRGEVARLQSQKGFQVWYVGPEQWTSNVQRLIDMASFEEMRVAGDGHYNAHGNLLVAKEIHATLKSAGALR